MSIESSYFAHLLRELSLKPDNYIAQERLIGLMATMKAQAETNPMTCYRLAQAYPSNSESWLELMQQAAKLGLTNAMYDLAVLSLKSKQPDKQAEALPYLQGILDSKDTFMISQAQELLAQYPGLMKPLCKPSTDQGNPHRLFKSKGYSADNGPDTSNTPDQGNNSLS